jgi:phosphoenolpyruvate---glycerone phosphotransferase subunit DhaL
VTASAVLDAQGALDWLRAVAASVAEQRDHLTELDAAIGDSDHGINLHRGFTAVVDALGQTSPAGPGAVLLTAGNTLVSKVGGASGPLYGTALRRMAKTLADTPAADARAVGDALQAAVDGIRALGGAQPGDKTMVDALEPAVRAYRDAVARGADLPQAVRSAVDAADEGRLATVDLQAKKGRASYLGPRSVGHEDPGAASSVLILQALAASLEGRSGS